MSKSKSDQFFLKKRKYTEVFNVKHLTFREFILGAKTIAEVPQNNLYKAYKSSAIFESFSEMFSVFRP
jgi:hypothetical protein